MASKFQREKRAATPPNEDPPWKSRFLPNSGILLGLKTGSLTPNLISGVLKYPHPEFYELLWELSWKANGNYDLDSMKKALLVCRWDDKRSTRELVQLAKLFQESPTGLTYVKTLQRRGGFDVFQHASELTKSSEISDQLLGIRILGHIEGPWCPLRSWIFRTLMGLLEEEPPQVIAAALECMLHWSSHDLTAVVSELEKHADQEIQSTSKQLLKEIESPNSFEGLLTLTTSQNIAVREAVLDYLHAALFVDERKSSQRATETTSSGSVTRLRVDDGESQPTTPQVLPVPAITYRKRIGLLGIVGIFVLAYPVKQFAQSFFIKSHPLAWVATPSGLDSDTNLPPPWESFNESELDTLIHGDDLEGDNLMMASRITRWIRFKNRPVRNLLNNSRETWALYNSMHAQLGAYLVSRASVPNPESVDERLDFRHLIRSLLMDVNNGFHVHAAMFLQYLAQFNGKLSSYLLLELSDKSVQLFFDDFVIELGTLIKSKQAMGPAGFHSSLNNLTPQARNRLAEQLNSGWVTDEERRLAKHLLSF